MDVPFVPNENVSAATVTGGQECKYETASEFSVVYERLSVIDDLPSLVSQHPLWE